MISIEKEGRSARITFDVMVNDSLRAYDYALKHLRFTQRPIGGGIITALAIGALAYIASTGEQENRLIHVGGFTIIFMIVIPLYIRVTQRDSRINAFRSKAGAGESFPAEVTLDESGVEFVDPGMTMVFPWRIVTEIRETESELVFFTSLGWVVLIPGQTFKDPGDRAQVAEVARTLRAGDSNRRETSSSNEHGGDSE